jgi:hypothetical protein
MQPPPPQCECELEDLEEDDREFFGEEDDE